MVALWVTTWWRCWSPLDGAVENHLVALLSITWWRYWLPLGGAVGWYLHFKCPGRN